MKFSEAMLLGLPEIRFTNNHFFYYNTADGSCSGCLVGAALYAVGRRNKADCGAATDAIRRWPWTGPIQPEILCPVCGADEPRSAIGYASHLANHYERKKITAEQIADIFRAMEPKEKEESNAIQRSDVVGVAGD